MVADLLSHPKRQFYPPPPPKIIGIHLSFITKIPGDTLLTKMPAELPSSEQIFTESSQLAPLIGITSDLHEKIQVKKFIYTTLFMRYYT